MHRKFRTKQIVTSVIVTLALFSCANTQSPLDGYEEVQPAEVQNLPDPSVAAFPAEAVERGRYLVTLLGCGNCHTDGALIGEPNASRILAGSEVGIAWSDPLQERYPGVVYPANLTPDPETGIGNWRIKQIVNMLQSGVDAHGSQSLPVMPWQAYSKLKQDDAAAIAMYLKSLPPVKHAVPGNVRPGQQAKAPYVHFGVYRSRQ